MRGVSQLSLFSAEARPTSLADLGGMLCGPARILRFGGGVAARLSLDLADAARAREVRAAAAPFGLAFEAGGHSCAGRELRTAYRRDLAGLAEAWTGPDRTKAVPTGFQLDGTALRLWVIAAGRPDGRGGYLLPLDGTAPATHDPLIAATTRLGLPPARIALGPCPTCAETASEPVDEAPPAGDADPTGSTGADAEHADRSSDPDSTSDAAPRTSASSAPGPRGDRATSRRDRSSHSEARSRSAAPSRSQGTSRSKVRSPSETPDDPADSPDPDGLPVVDLADLAPPPGPVLLPLCPDHHRALECRRAGPALRITGARRMQRLVELVGPPPEGVDPTGWPQYRGRTWS